MQISKNWEFPLWNTLDEPLQAPGPIVPLRAFPLGDDHLTELAGGLVLKETPFLSLGSRSRSHTRSICCDKHEDLYLYLRLIEKGLPPIARYMVLDKKEQM